jgi:hypothetical protein
VNESIQDPEINILAQNDKVNAVMKMLETCKRMIGRNIFYMFPTSDRRRPNNEAEANKELGETETYLAPTSQDQRRANGSLKETFDADEFLQFWLIKKKKD